MSGFVRFCCRFLVLLWFASPDVKAAANYRPISMHAFGVLNFKVVEVGGVVMFAKPLSGEFRLAKVGQVIPDGSILRVEENSWIGFEAEDSLGREGMAVKKTRITINVPTILRLGRDSFRKIKMDPKLLSQFDSKIKKTIGDPASIFRKLSDAWKQAAAMISPDSGMDEETLRQIVAALNKGRAKDDVSISVMQGRLDFITPKARQVLLTDRFPAEMDVSWKRSDNQVQDLSQYDVYFWPQGESKSPYGRSTGGKYKISVKKPGTYYMQVESSDGTYKSKIIAVKIDLPKSTLKDAPKFADHSREASIKATLGRRIKAIAPDRNLVWYGNRRWPVFGFEWTRPDVCTENVVYEFIVTDQKSKQIYKRTVNTQAHQWRPPAELSGPLFWEAKVIGCMAAGKKIIDLRVGTIPRKLELLREVPGVEALKKISRNRFNGTLFFESL